MPYVIKEHGKTTTYEGISKNWKDGEPIVVIADEDTLDVFTLDNPDDLRGIESYVDDQPCTRLLGVFVPYNRQVKL